jgi:hypothetical protein
MPECRDYAREQFALAHKYQNALIHLERKLYYAKIDIEKQVDPTLEAAFTAYTEAEKALDEAVKTFQRSKVTTQDKQGSAEAKEQIRVCRTARNAAQKALAAQRKDARKQAAYTTLLEPVMLAHYEAIRATYAQFGRLWWGTRNHVRMRVEAATAKRLKTKGLPPDYQQESRDAVLYTQVQKNGTIAEVFSGRSTNLQIVPCDEKGKWYWVRMRVGSDERRRPIWCTVRTRISRPFPTEVEVNGEMRSTDCKITGVQLVRRGFVHHRMSDGRWHPMDDWEVQFSLSFNGVRRAYDPNKCECVAIDLGWRLRPGGLRVAYWVDWDGERGELLIPNSELELMDKNAHMQGVRTDLKNECFQAVVQWYDANVMEVTLLPDWLQALQIQNCKVWKAAFPLCRLLDALEDHPDYAPELLKQLRAWREREAHLQAYQQGNEWHMRARRLDQYRKWAAEFERKYNRVVFEDMDIAELRKNDPVEEDETANIAIEQMRKYRNLAAIGLLRKCFISKFTQHWAVEGETAFTTIMCSGCETINELRTGRLLMTCTGCGRTIDQDENACLNLLESPEVAQALTVKELPPVKPKEKGRFAKRKEIREQRQNPPTGSIE